MVGVVVVSVVGGQDLCFGQGAELLDVEQLVAQAGVEGLDVGVLPGRARLDVGAGGGSRPTPLAQDAGGQLGPVVRADVLGGEATLGDQALEHGDGLIGIDRALAADRQRLAGELVDDV